MKTQSLARCGRLYAQTAANVLRFGISMAPSTREPEMQFKECERGHVWAWFLRQAGCPTCGSRKWTPLSDDPGGESR